MSGEVSALVEVASNTDRKGLGVNPYQFERNQHDNSPAEDFPIDFQRFPFKGAVADDSCKKSGIQRLAVLPSCAAGRQQAADASKLEIVV